MSGLQRIEHMEEARAVEHDRLAGRRYPHLPRCRGDEPTVWIAFAAGICEFPVLHAKRMLPDEIAAWACRHLGLKHARGDRYTAPLGWVPPYERVIGGIALRCMADVAAWERIAERGRPVPGHAPESAAA